MDNGCKQCEKISKTKRCGVIKVSVHALCNVQCAWGKETKFLALSDEHFHSSLLTLSDLIVQLVCCCTLQVYDRERKMSGKGFAALVADKSIKVIRIVMQVKWWSRR